MYLSAMRSTVALATRPLHNEHRHVSLPSLVCDPFNTIPTQNGLGAGTGLAAGHMPASRPCITKVLI